MTSRKDERPKVDLKYNKESSAPLFPVVDDNVLRDVALTAELFIARSILFPQPVPFCFDKRENPPLIPLNVSR